MAEIYLAAANRLFKQTEPALKSMKLFLCQAAKHSCLRIRTASDADANSVISRTSGTSVQCGPTDQIGLLWRHQVAAIGSARTGNGMGATGWGRPTARSRSARRAATTALFPTFRTR